MTKYFCDECDNEIKNSLNSNKTIEVISGRKLGSAWTVMFEISRHGEYKICPSCACIIIGSAYEKLVEARKSPKAA